MARTSTSFSHCLKQPEFRPVFYLSPFILAAVIIGFVFLPAPWNLIVAAILLLVWLLLMGLSWRLAKANVHIKTEAVERRSIIEHLPIGILSYNNDFAVTAFNPAAQEIFQLAAEDVIGKKLSADMASDPRFKTLISIVFSTLAPVVIRRSDPGAFPQILDISFEDPKLDLRVITDRILDEGGAPMGFIKLISDRTRENQLLRAKTEFISVAAHQLRTPLTAVNWAFEALAGAQLPPEQTELVATGFSAAKKMLKTVNDLLDVSKIEEGRFGYQFEEVDIVSYLEEVLASSNQMAAQYGIKLYFQRPAETMPHALVDKQKLSMVLYNLLDNAIKYNVQNGQVTVAVTKEEGEPFLRVSVQDTGIGITPDEVEKLFGKFFRASNAIKAVPDGTGLGLYIARNIIQRHGGRMWVESELNRGTTFFLTLPTDPALIPKKEWTGFE